MLKKIDFFLFLVKENFKKSQFGFGFLKEGLTTTVLHCC